MEHSTNARIAHWLSIGLLSILGLAFVDALRSAPAPVAVSCLVGVEIAHDSATLTVAPRRRPLVINDSVYVVPTHPWVLVCTQFGGPPIDDPAAIRLSW